jgi:hypothetical protein
MNTREAGEERSPSSRYHPDGRRKRRGQTLPVGHRAAARSHAQAQPSMASGVDRTSRALWHVLRRVCGGHNPGPIRSSAGR